MAKIHHFQMDTSEYHQTRIISWA